MAHHLAELLIQADANCLPRQRLRAQQSAALVTLKLWKHRADALRSIDPMLRYGELIQYLDELRSPSGRYFPGRRIKTGSEGIKDSVANIYASTKSLAALISASLVRARPAPSSDPLASALTTAEKDFAAGADDLKVEMDDVLPIWIWPYKKEPAESPELEALEYLQSTVDELQEQVTHLNSLIEAARMSLKESPPA
ncbi:MAG: hypothetical protein JWQ49_853 [Edaphobacter sp.]|nr:hypothetical protein [Edaphobacter sp.]